MRDENFQHIPVLLKETVENLKCKKNGNLF